jgi:hypothetical protein
MRSLLAALLLFFPPRGLWSRRTPPCKNNRKTEAKHIASLTIHLGLACFLRRTPALAAGSSPCCRFLFCSVLESSKRPPGPYPSPSSLAPIPACPFSCCLHQTPCRFIRVNKPSLFYQGHRLFLCAGPACGAGGSGSHPGQPAVNAPSLFSPTPFSFQKTGFSRRPWAFFIPLPPF